MAKREDRKKLLERVINTSYKKGASLNHILKGKSVSELVRLSERNFSRLVERIKEAPKLQKDLEKYEKETKPKNIAKIEKAKMDKEIKRISKKVLKDIKKANLSSDALTKVKGFENRKNFAHFQPFTQAKNLKELYEMEYNLNKSKSFKEEVEEFTKKEASEFLFKYFKELELSHEEHKRIEKLSSSFGTNIDEFYDLVDVITSDDFKVYTDGKTGGLVHKNTDSWYDMMKNRLSTVESMRTMTKK